jgi:dTDP-glucose 4,6-dehydratase
MDATKIGRELRWTPRETFDSGLRKTVAWYLENRWWWEEIWARRYHGERLGMAASQPPNPTRAKSGLPRAGQ